MQELLSTVQSNWLKYIIRQVVFNYKPHESYYFIKFPSK